MHLRTHSQTNNPAHRSLLQQLFLLPLNWINSFKLTELLFTTPQNHTKPDNLHICFEFALLPLQVQNHVVFIVAVKHPVVPQLHYSEGKQKSSVAIIALLTQ